MGSERRGGGSRRRPLVPQRRRPLRGRPPPAPRAPRTAGTSSGSSTPRLARTTTSAATTTIPATARAARTVRRRCGRGRPGDQHDQQGERNGDGLPQDPLPHHGADRPVRQPAVDVAQHATGQHGVEELRPVVRRSRRAERHVDAVRARHEPPALGAAHGGPGDQSQRSRCRPRSDCSQARHERPGTQLRRQHTQHRQPDRDPRRRPPPSGHPPSCPALRRYVGLGSGTADSGTSYEVVAMATTSYDVMRAAAPTYAPAPRIDAEPAWARRRSSATRLPQLSRA